MKNPVQALHELDQSIWYDNIERRLLQNGELAAMIDEGLIRGITSNPSIFNKAIANSNDYDEALKPMAWSGLAPEKIFFELAIEDIRAAADLFAPLYKETKGGDGYVSLEVSPFLANDTEATITQVKELWKTVNRPNLMIKIPATLAGLPAITAAIAAGINVNVTLIFSIERYAKVIDAYLAGLEQRLAADLPVDSIASVASFFVSRLDSKVDKALERIDTADASSLMGKVALANSRLAYALYEEKFGTPRFAALADKGAHAQRPLWASTGTKNPAYSDVLYVDELIAPNTVNTVPPHTLENFRDHGNPALSLQGHQDESRAILEKLAALGISLDQATRKLEEEGVKSFADAFTDLLNTIADRAKLAQAELGPLAKHIPARVSALAEANTVQRIFDHDPSLWTDDPDGQAEISKRLGWLTAPTDSRQLIPQLNELLAACQDDGYTNVLLLGMGGSSLAPEVIAETFGVQSANGKPGLALKILDSTDPAQVKAALESSEIAKTLYVVASKSGSTSEVMAFYDFFWAQARQALGDSAAQHFVAITDPGSKLAAIATQQNFRKIILADPAIGGRYSALIAFGLTAAALIGMDLADFLERASRMAELCQPTVSPERNPGLVLGAIIGQAALRGRDKLTILTDPELRSFGSWLEQLIAESSGKQGKGIVPVDIEPQAKAGKYSTDRLFVYINTSDTQASFITALQQARQPVVQIRMADLADLGAEFYRWEFATAVACAVIGVNAFDQPDVQDNKIRTLNKTREYKQTQAFDEGEPIWENAAGKVFSDTLPNIENAWSLSDVIDIFLKQAGTGDYVAINAYLPRNEKTLAALQKFRAAIQKHTGLATTLGFGPRFLHSTGQLHKGGANTGLFIEITAEPREDLDIPGQGISFGNMERAQALGDLEALFARQRRAIRVHLLDARIEDLY
ncbi:MAG: bifunctional transaldolase/phosoglucose isomerase [Anaerolineaceae bacterium]|jgi:transaldolase/glucose-6-phosphate isomerase|nr:bifunctional transaldolase/phosoglucose isomerase [Anaerolineaceae bacterium]